MKFIYIIENDRIIIEVQQNRDKISPFIRNKKQIDNLEDKLVFKADKIIFQFIKFLNQTYPPYNISNEFIFKELLDLIKETRFVFLKKNKNSSLKKVLDYSKLDNLTTNTQKIKLQVNRVKILIQKILKQKVKVEYFFNIDGVQKLIPINYDFFIPILETNKVGYIDTTTKNSINKQFFKIFNKNIEESSYLTFCELKQINQNELFIVEYQASQNKSSDISFVSNNLFKMNIFNKNDLKDADLDFYYSVLENYLKGKNFIEYKNEIVLFDEKKIIKELDSKTLLKVFSYELKDEIKQFIERLNNIQPKINKSELLSALKKKDFKATLKSYQEDGVLWLYSLYKNEIDGGLLADEMGLGKTIQVIAFILLSSAKKVLIVSPASLIHNWKNEILKFTNYQESDISLDLKDNMSLFTILSYETVRSKVDIIRENKYDILIMDESQKIKNHQTKIFQAVGQVKRNFTIIMTGTPIENSLNDLWNMLFTINPSLHELYTKKIQPLLKDIDSYDKAIELTIKILYPIMIQRRKNDVLDLPPRDTKTLFIDFTEEEKIKYNQLVNVFISAIKSGLSGRVQSIALEGLLRLRQFCSIHSISPKTLINTNNLIDSKLNKSLEIVKECMKKNEKIIIFSQFTDSLDKIEEILNQNNLNYLRLDGSTTKKNRDLQVKEFQNSNSNYNIFLISLKAGGVGLNLTSATTAILFEPWWNPAVEEQAFARIDRIGQDKETKIYRLIYKDSIEEKINNLIEQKQGIFISMTNLLVNRKNLEMEVAKDIFKIS